MPEYHRIKPGGPDTEMGPVYLAGMDYQDTTTAISSSAGFRGRGAGINPANQFLAQHIDVQNTEGVDEPLPTNPATTTVPARASTMINKVDSPDIGLTASVNPYQGCEHGCIYCYARNSHEYWGFSAGLDFESRIVVKENAPEVLSAELRKRNYKPVPIMLSGNTDCYQPLERKYGLTRRMLQVLLHHRHPVGIITKNSLVLRDLDILRPLAEQRLVHIWISLTTLDESTRLRMEPRTATASQRLKVIETLAREGIPVGAMCAPIVPGLTHHELPDLVAAAAEAGAQNVGYQIVRLNGAIGEIFAEWAHRNYPDRAEKMLHQIAETHGGKLSDSRFHTRMKGEGSIAGVIRQLFQVAKAKHFEGRSIPDYNLNLFQPNPDQGSLF